MINGSQMFVNAIRSVLSNRVGTEGIQKEREFLKSVEFTLSDLNMWDGKNLVFFQGVFILRSETKSLLLKTSSSKLITLMKASCYCYRNKSYEFVHDIMRNPKYMIPRRPIENMKSKLRR